MAYVFDDHRAIFAGFTLRSSISRLRTTTWNSKLSYDSKLLYNSPQSDSSSQVTSRHAPSGLAAGAESMDVGPQVPENSQNVPTPTPHPGNLKATDDDIVD